MAKRSGFLGAALFGAAIGAAAALFVAPKKGDDLRKQALNKYNDFREDPQGTLEDLRDFSVDKFYDIKDKFDSGDYSAEAAKDFLIAKRDEIKAKVESGELSLETVKDFFNSTKSSLGDHLAELVSQEDDEDDLGMDYSWTEDPGEDYTEE